MNGNQRVFSVLEDRKEINEHLANGWKIEGMLTQNIVLLIKESNIKVVSPIVTGG